jgi:hypothetical protein
MTHRYFDKLHKKTSSTILRWSKMLLMSLVSILYKTFSCKIGLLITTYMRNNDINETISIFVKHLDLPKKKSLRSKKNSLANVRATVLVNIEITRYKY